MNLLESKERAPLQVCGAIIENSDGQFLLQERDDKAPSYPLCWSLFGGQVEENETPEQTILRELAEEIGLDRSKIKSAKLVQENVQQNGTKQYVFHIITDAKIEEMTLSEGKSMAFVSKEELFNRNFAFNIKEILEKYMTK